MEDPIRLVRKYWMAKDLSNIVGFRSSSAHFGRTYGHEFVEHRVPRFQTAHFPNSAFLTWKLPFGLAPWPQIHRTSWASISNCTFSQLGVSQLEDPGGLLYGHDFVEHRGHRSKKCSLPTSAFLTWNIPYAKWPRFRRTSGFLRWPNPRRVLAGLYPALPRECRRKELRLPSAYTGVESSGELHEAGRTIDRARAEEGGHINVQCGGQLCLITKSIDGHCPVSSREQI